MMFRAIFGLSIVIGIVSVQPAFAANSVQARLVEATDGNSGIDKRLSDVASVLKSQLRFSQYTLVDTQRFSLPANETVGFARGLQLVCSGKQHDLRLEILQGGTRKLQTTVDLKDGKPLVLGGFPSSGGKLIIILLTK